MIVQRAGYKCCACRFVNIIIIGVEYGHIFKYLDKEKR